MGKNTSTYVLEINVDFKITLVPPRAVDGERSAGAEAGVKDGEGVGGAVDRGNSSVDALRPDVEGGDLGLARREILIASKNAS